VTRGSGLGMLRAVFRPVVPALLALTLCLCAFGCSSGTETGNPPFQAELSYGALSSAPLLIGVGEPGSEGVVESAWLDLGAVSLIGVGSCAEPEPMGILVPALGVGDHASGKHNSTQFPLAASEYCGLDLPFLRAMPQDIQNGVPKELEEHSVMLEGALADGTPFTLLAPATPTVRLKADAGGFEISQQHAKTLITFDVATWLANLDWSNAKRIDGAIVISADDNPALLAQFESNLARGVALYRDADGDGKLDTDPVRLAHGE